MNSLLKRQIKKYGIQELNENSDIQGFIEAVGKSYDNFGEQFNMLQRSMFISSEELYEANKRLKKDALQQQEIIKKLKSVIAVLKGKQNDEIEDSTKSDKDNKQLINLMELQAQQIVEMNEQREELLKELEHQNRELSDYAHVVSHDLKSPLRSIDALVEWLREDYADSLDVEGQETLHLIRNNVAKMEALITGILEYSTIDKNNYKTYRVNLHTLVEDVLNFVDIPKSIDVRVNNLLPSVNGDKYRLQQLFQNLIDNAITYNDKENGLIEIGCVDVGEYYEFYIRDNGKGIEKKFLNKIFKAFFKLGNKESSVGIGLSIVKKIVELYEGKIWVLSKLEQGTTIYFTLKK